MSVHRERMGSLLRRTVQEILDRGLADPRIRGMISVTSVRVSEDFADATIMISVMPSADASLTMHGLRAAASRVRAAVAKRADLRRTPRLHFRLDSAARRESDVLAAIREAVGESPDDAADPVGSDAAASDAPNDRPEAPPTPKKWGRPWTDDESSDVEENRS